jgi:hypothetical protein
MYHLAMDIGETEVATLESVGELRVIEAEQMENRRVQVVNMDRVASDVESKIIGRAVRIAALHAAASHPHAEAPVVVIPTIVAALYHWRAAEFTAPNH